MVASARALPFLFSFGSLPCKNRVRDAAEVYFPQAIMSSNPSFGSKPERQNSYGKEAKNNAPGVTHESEIWLIIVPIRLGIDRMERVKNDLKNA